MFDYCLLCLFLLVSGHRFDDHDLEEEPLMILSCGHVFTLSTLDGHVGMGNYYEVDPTGRYINVAHLEAGFTNMPLCPECRSPLRSVKRYGRAVKKSLIELSQKR